MVFSDKTQKLSVYFVYKFVIPKIGLFYIGATTDIDRRKSDHLSKINCQIKKYRFDRAYPSDAVGYEQAAIAIIRGMRYYDILDWKIKYPCRIEVISIEDTPEAAAALEHFYITKNKGNPKCFNIHKYSNYYARK